MFVHPAAVRQAALDLIASGLNDCEVSRRIGVPRRTVRDWRVQQPRQRYCCWRCWTPTSLVRYTAADYAELLGLYLGDGHISVMARTQRLRLMLDTKYPVIVRDAAELLARVVPENKVGRQLVHEGHMATLHAYHQHWTCLFPQHGPGKKHDRTIVLESWQQEMLEQAPWSFLRGCIRSDGCVFINRTGKYSYESYEFSNHSSGILGLFVSTCAGLGVECRVYERHVRINRRASVALMLEHVGRKA
jgi:Homeodomain-like domain-containing protein